MVISRRRALGIGRGIGILSSLIGATACLNRPIEPVEPRTTTVSVNVAKHDAVDKIDLLLMIDNSTSMHDKQEILAKAVPDLVDRLVSPRCVDANGAPQPTQPPSAADDCDEGFAREFQPILDIDIGVVSSSLGSLGSDQCPATVVGNDDRGELVARAGAAPTYDDHGFLAWDPGGKRTPKGIADAATLKTSFADLVEGVGQTGCGYEMQLESVYRFLVDPAPYGSLAKDASGGDVPPTHKTGVDRTILDERADFLRPDSLVVVLMLTDEDDCSVKAGGTDYQVLNSAPNHKAASICASDPGNACCYGCGDAPPDGCPADPACAAKPTYSGEEDGPNLRCWHQRERYGIDALYPTTRYVNAFTEPEIDPDQPDLAVRDPAKAQLNPLFGPMRDHHHVYVAGIVGVPWQALARTNADGEPDLAKGFQSATELTKAGFWARFVGDPDGHREPTEAIMQENWQKRAGVTADAPNGGDRTIDPNAPNDLQYTCIFPLDVPQPNTQDCAGAPADNPLCQGTTQVNAKAYPGLRELAVLHGLGDQGIPASICPENASQPTNADGSPAPDYGYRPAVATIIDQLKGQLQQTCLPQRLTPDDGGQVPCVVLEARHTGNGQLDCASLPGRREVSDVDHPAIEAALQSAEAPAAPYEWDSFCEIVPLEGDPTDHSSPIGQCQWREESEIDASVSGWCYVDAGPPPVGNPDLGDLKSCPLDEKRLVRLVHDGNVQKGATAVVTCAGEGTF